MDSAERRFRDFVVRKTAAAETARIAPLETVIRGPDAALWPHVGNDWTRRLYDGGFHLSPASPDIPAVSLVFVQSRDGNTGTRRPDELGGGPTDLHLIYEGLSRVAADAVLAGASTVAGGDVFFSVWHPALVQLRASLGLPRHPIQIVVSENGRANLDSTLLFNVPEVPVYVLAGAVCRGRYAAGFARRPWITIVPLPTDGIAGALRALKQDHGIHRISCVGGRTTASSLIDAGVVQDLCLTTTAKDGGEPGTPFYTGKAALSLRVVERKRGTDSFAPIEFAHLELDRSIVSRPVATEVPT